MHPRHRRDAVRHGDARLALDLPHGPRRAARRRGRARRSSQALGARARPAGRHQLLDRRAVPEEVRHAGRQHHRHRHLHSRLRAAATGTGQSPEVTPFWMVGGAGAEVEVDTETGHVRITRLINVADVGQPINPKIVERRFPAAPSCSSASRCSRRCIFDDGQVTNASLADYKIPGILDVPPGCRTRPSRPIQHNGPFGAKGVGESATFASRRPSPTPSTTPSACALTELPLTPEAVLSRAAGEQSNPLEDDVSHECRANDPLHPERPSRSRADVAPHDNLVEVLRATSACSARARAAARACAAAAPCSSTAARCPAASISRLRGRRRGGHDRGSRRGRHARSGAAGLHRSRRVPVRLLHARLRADGASNCSTPSGSRRRTRSAIICPAICAAARPIRKS